MFGRGICEEYQSRVEKFPEPKGEGNLLSRLVFEKKSFSNLKEWWNIAKIKIKSITIEASKKVNITDDKIKVLENKLEALKDISEPSRQQLEELAD
jgi:hypothetical protein